MKTRFKGHETFYFREGWLSKALFEIKAHNEVQLFKDNNGISKLGVGSNMVKSIKYWMIACGLLEYDYTNKSYILTKLGEIIEQNDGYLEDDFTLWILHTNLVRNYEEATTWNLFFNEFNAERFTSEDAKMALKNYLNSHEIRYAEKSLDLDVNLLLNMYIGKQNSNPEENLICPLSRLNILSLEGDKYIKNAPDFKMLDELVILYALVLQAEDNNYININTLEKGLNGLGNIYNLNRVMINEYLESLVNQGYLRMEKTAGLDMLYILKNLNPENIVEEYYERRGML